MNWLTAVWVSVICHQLIPSIPEEPAMEEELLSSAVQRQCCTLGSPSTQHVALLPAGTSHLTWPLFSMGKQNTVCSFRVKKKKNVPLLLHGMTTDPLDIVVRTHMVLCGVPCMEEVLSWELRRFPIQLRTLPFATSWRSPSNRRV